MVSNVARLTSALRSSVFDEETSSASAPEPTFAEKIDSARRDLAKNGVALFTDEHGRRFRIVRKPA